MPEVDREALLSALEEIAPTVLPYAAPVWKVLAEKTQGRKTYFV